MIVWSDYPPGNHRIGCICGVGSIKKNVGVTIYPDGGGRAHCWKCGLKETYFPKRGVYRPATVACIVKAQPQKHERLSEWGHALWSECQPISGVATVYLQARRCVIPPTDGDLRWHPSLKHPSGHVGPALVALVTNAVTREALSLHRTWITPTGKASLETPRMPLANHSLKNGVIRLWPDEAVTYGLGIAEGIETALSLAWAYSPVWSVIDAGHMAQFPVLEGIETLFIAQDQDPAGQSAASTCARRWTDAGCEVFITDQTTNDLNDSLKEAA